MYERSCQACTWTSWSQPVIRSQPCHTIVRLTIVQKVSCCACCQRIQLESSSLSLSFTPTLQSGSSPSRSFLVSCPDYFSLSGKIVWWTAYTILVPIFWNHHDVTSAGLWIKKPSSKQRTPKQPTCTPFERYNSLVYMGQLGLPDQCPFRW